MNSTGAARACWIGASRCRGWPNAKTLPGRSTGATTRNCPSATSSNWPRSSSSTPRKTSCCIGQPGTGKSHVAKALALLAVERGYKVLYREAHSLDRRTSTKPANSAKSRKFRAHLKAAELLVIDDLFLRRLPAIAGDELADVLMSRYEKVSTIVTSNRPIDDWAALLGDVVVVAPLLDRLMHHGHLLKFDGKSWRLKEAAERVAKHASAA